MYQDHSLCHLGCGTDGTDQANASISLVDLESGAVQARLAFPRRVSLRFTLKKYGFAHTRRLQRRLFELTGFPALLVHPNYTYSLNPLPRFFVSLASRVPAVRGGLQKTPIEDLQLFPSNKASGQSWRRVQLRRRPSMDEKVSYVVPGTL